ncbi:hypothetical protein Naga_100115g8 [Nannochloropsis gaditana]|uniref:Uncharacterized protein n=1 Tax=Nannochloropsis gaditana TaxID=72520 RepID=W7TSE2_9STRA|nr:hypothetical protein Naga_100115g8 [Nannochloropsis gaditana]
MCKCKTIGCDTKRYRGGRGLAGGRRGEAMPRYLVSSAQKTSLDGSPFLGRQHIQVHCSVFLISGRQLGRRYVRTHGKASSNRIHVFCKNDWYEGTCALYVAVLCGGQDLHTCPRPALACTAGRDILNLKNEQRDT